MHLTITKDNDILNERKQTEGCQMKMKMRMDGAAQFDGIVLIAIFMAIFTYILDLGRGYVERAQLIIPQSIRETDRYQGFAWFVDGMFSNPYIAMFSLLVIWLSICFIITTICNIVSILKGRSKENNWGG